MLKQAENTVKIEGILSEIDIDYGTFKKNGTDVNSIRGVIKVRVNQDINGVPTELEIPVHLFASQYTNAGALNPAYESIERIKKEYVSIASSDIDHADRVRITKGAIQMNEYYGQNGNLISFPRITASFVTKISTPYNATSSRMLPLKLRVMMLTSLYKSPFIVHPSHCKSA